MSVEFAETSMHLDPLDSLLSRHPFGDNEYLSRELQTAYRRRLRKLSPQTPLAGQLLDALTDQDPVRQRRVLGDPILRCAIDHALVQATTGQRHGLPMDQCTQLLQDTIHHVEGNPDRGPLASLLTRRLGAHLDDSWVWDDDHPDDRFADALRYLVLDHYGGEATKASNEEYATLQQGVKLLTDLLPLSSRNALSHTRIVAIVPVSGAWATMNSSSEYKLGGTIFLSRRLLANPFQVAEFVFHETLHQQMYDFRQAHSLLSQDYDRDDAPTIPSLWNVPGNNEWDIHRALAAFHVYVHLGLLATIAERRATELERRYEAPIQMTGSRAALSRAQYLGEQIRDRCWAELGLAGKKFVDWFSSVLDYVDGAPPPNNAYLHLLIDRYLRETRSIESRLEHGDYSAAALNELARLGESEVTFTRSLLATLNADASLRAFDASVDAGRDATAAATANPAAQLIKIRRAVAKAIDEVSPDGYTLSESRLLDEDFRAIVERSSVALMSVVHK